MNRVLLIVEGQTETAVFRNVLAEYLATHGIAIFPRTVGKPGHKGGNQFAKSLRDIVNLIKQEPQSVVTTFFDYYALPDEWPGCRDSGKVATVKEKRIIVEDGIRRAVQAELGSKFNPAKFIPYIQMYELESLFFSDPAVMAHVFSKKVESFAEIVEQCGSCEEINDHRDTAPSKRIMKLFPGYKKGSGVNAHAPLIVQKIGIEKIRDKCPNFNWWVEQLIKAGKR